MCYCHIRQELASRQLKASIASFFDHVKLLLSNRAFESSLSANGADRDRWGHLDSTGPEPPENQSWIEDLEATMESLSHVLALECSCTKEFQRLTQLST